MNTVLLRYRIAVIKPWLSIMKSINILNKVQREELHKDCIIMPAISMLCVAITFKPKWMLCPYYVMSIVNVTALPASLTLGVSTQAERYHNCTITPLLLILQYTMLQYTQHQWHNSQCCWPLLQPYFEQGFFFSCLLCCHNSVMNYILHGIRSESYSKSTYKLCALS